MSGLAKFWLLLAGVNAVIAVTQTVTGNYSAALSAACFALLNVYIAVLVDSNARLRRTYERVS